MVPIVRSVVDPRYRRVVAVMGAQMGKTDGVLNVMGARLDDDPVPMLYVGPSRNFVESQVEPRLMAMVASAPSLRAKLATGKRNRKTKKAIAGVDVRLAWAGSATELAAQAAGLALVDERDRMESDVAGEGDPVELIEARGSTFPDFCLVVTSTPTKGNVETFAHPETSVVHWQVAEPADVESPTWRLWQEGTRHEWAWPCPDCGGYFVPRFALLKWPEGAGPARAGREARLCCPHCGTLLDEAAKTAMNARGRFLAPGQRVADDGTVTGPEPEGDTASFWVSGLCSPWVPWSRRVKAFLAAVRAGDDGRLQAVINTGFGELYRTVPAEARPWESVAALREPYPFDAVPDAVQVLTAGVDVQKNRLVYAVRGWAYRHESWLIRHGEIFGETDQDAVWHDLAALLDRDFDGHRIRLMLVDSGYRPGDKFQRPDHAIYEFARRHPARVRATKGHDRQSKPISAATIDVTTARGKPMKRGLQLWHLDGDYLKGWIMQRLGWPADEPGAWHLSGDTTDDYCRQLVAEQRIVKPSGAAVWFRIRKDNHYLDAEALNVAAALMLQVHALRPVPVPPSTMPTTVRSRWLDG